MVRRTAGVLLMWCLSLVEPTQTAQNRHPLVQVLTVATHESPALDNLRHSVEHHGYALRVLGMGMDFDRTGLKAEILMGYLKTADPHLIVIFTDAYDVIFLADASEMLGTFLAMETPILMAAEKGCWPGAFCSGMASVQYQKIAPQHYYPFLNSGFFIGYTAAIKEVLDEVLRFPVYEDQQAITRYYLTHQEDPRPLIQLDHEARIAICLTQLSSSNLKYDMDLGRWTDMQTGHAPLVLHGNGDDGSNLLISLMNQHPPSFDVNTSAWNKNSVMPKKSDVSFSFWMLQEPHVYEPKHLQLVDVISFWYNQFVVAHRSKNHELAHQAYEHFYQNAVYKFYDLDNLQRETVVHILKLLDARIKK